MDRLLSLFHFFIFCFNFHCTHSSLYYYFNVSYDQNVAELKHFWKSTGLCPPDPHQDDFKYFLSEDEKQNLALIGSVPRSGIEQVRIHWLLDLVKVKSVSGSSIEYDFTLLDQMVALLHVNHLRPGFELMGNPSDWYTDFENSTQVFAWRDLVKTLASRYIGLYGIEDVKEWNFESWNEPDHGDFDKLNFTTQGFLNYYDACSEGLKAANPSLRLGGPADSCREPTPKVVRKSWALLDHCVNGLNYFTKEKGVRLDYISVHLKGGGSSMTILNEELAKITEIQEKYPEYLHVPFYNDEADPLVGWSKPEWWRADATYAAIVAKVIYQHQNLLIRQHPNISYMLLSNDNGFLNFYPSYFDQRTLVTRFQMNETKPPSVQTIKKPVLSVMGLLALLGEQQVHVRNMFARVKGSMAESDVGVLATYHTPAKNSGADSWQASIIIHDSADTSNVTDIDRIRVEVDGINPSLISNKQGGVVDLVYAQYQLDSFYGDPSAIWKQYGSPIYPTREQFRQMRQNQEPVRVEGPQPITPIFGIEFSLRKPGVSLIHVCAKPSAGPEQVTGLRLHQVTASDVMVIWDDSNITTRCIQTYEVAFSPTGADGSYQRINSVDLIFTAFVYSPDQMDPDDVSPISGWYRVRVVDYWGQRGPFSDPVQLKTPSHANHF